jgi:hypothetical protein
MMNGAVVIADKVLAGDFNSPGLVNLQGVRYAFIHNQIHTVGVWGYFSIERMGQFHLDLKTVHRVTGKTYLIHHEVAEVKPHHLKRRVFFFTFRNVDVILPQSGLWAFDFDVDGITYATMPIEAV